MTYNLCDQCKIVVLGEADDDAVKPYHEEFCSLSGMLADAGTIPMGGYWDCECCGETSIGSAEVVETV